MRGNVMGAPSGIKLDPFHCIHPKPSYHASLPHCILGLRSHALQEVKVLRFYKRPWWKLSLFFIVSALSSGILWLASLWAPALFSSLTMSRSSPEDADYVYVEVGCAELCCHMCACLAAGQAVRHQQGAQMFFTWL
eukprot:1157264-Pelagomonas_calceolata.AAC.5